MKREKPIRPTESFRIEAVPARPRDQPLENARSSRSSLLSLFLFVPGAAERLARLRRLMLAAAEKVEGVDRIYVCSQTDGAVLVTDGRTASVPTQKGCS